jgi:hypothetical protein
MTGQDRCVSETEANSSWTGWSSHLLVPQCEIHVAVPAVGVPRATSNDFPKNRRICLHGEIVTIQSTLSVRSRKSLLLPIPHQRYPGGRTSRTPRPPRRVRAPVRPGKAPPRSPSQGPAGSGSRRSSDSRRWADSALCRAAYAVRKWPGRFSRTNRAKTPGDNLLSRDISSDYHRRLRA